MLDKIDSYTKLVRLFSPTGYLLLFFPCAFSLLANSPAFNPTLTYYLLLFFIGSITMRSSGCIINDLIDRHIDGLVARTENRPLAARTISVKQALYLLALLLLCSFVILLALPAKALWLGVLALLMTAIYPKMKQITYWPQLFLGFTFNLGALFASIAVTETITPEALQIYIACVFWTLGYDTIYGYMDHLDDKKIGVKSLSLYLLHKNYKLYLGVFYSIFVAMIFHGSNFGNNYSYILLVIAAANLAWQLFTLDITSTANCLARFKNNNLVGALIAAAYLLPITI